MKMQEITVFLKSGNVMKVECKSAEFKSKDGEYVGYKILGAKTTFGIDPTQIEAWQAVDIREESK